MSASVAMAAKSSVPYPKKPPPTHLQPLKRGQGRRERAEQERLNKLRNEQPNLTQRETCEYRNSFYQNLCIVMLKDGYHRTFSELFSLIAQQKETREAAGPESIIWNLTPLNEEKTKLLKLRECLTEAEDAEREDGYHAMYRSYSTLAIYFEEDPFDKWLSDHYYEKCLQVSDKISDDEGRRKAESHFNMGLAFEKSAKLTSAIDHLLRYYEITQEKEWFDADGHLLHSCSCEHLARLFGNLAKLENTAPNDAVEHLKNAYKMATESGNRKLEAITGYQLGLGYEKIGKPDTALFFLRNFYELAKSIKDEESLGLACEAMAKAFEKQGKTEESIKFLEEFVDVTERSKQDKLYSRACRGLGAVYNNMGKYAQASDFFIKAFTVARTLNDVASVNLSRTQAGVAKGCQLDAAFRDHLEAVSRQRIQRVLEWKSSRALNFEKPIQDSLTMTMASRRPQVVFTKPLVATQASIVESASKETTLVSEISNVDDQSVKN